MSRSPKSPALAMGRMLTRPRTHLHSLSATTAVSIAIGGMAAGIFALSTGEAWPHDAIPTAAQPQGWAYPGICCSGIDCREVPDADIIEGIRGYEIRKTGELIPMTDPKIKSSPDGAFHWCSVNGLDDSNTICLFVPARSY